jgi:hypothetical protein
MFFILAPSFSISELMSREAFRARLLPHQRVAHNNITFVGLWKHFGRFQTVADE